MLQVFLQNVTFVSDVCCKRFDLYVLYVSHVCCKSMFQMFLLFLVLRASVFMLQVFYLDVAYDAISIYVCCKCVFQIFQLFQMYVASVLSGMLHML
jgi:hypothetical protein